MRDQQADWVVWVKENGAWRVQSCHTSLIEANRVTLECRKDGLETRRVMRDDQTDREMRANVSAK